MKSEQKSYRTLQHKNSLKSILMVLNPWNILFFEIFFSQLLVTMRLTVKTKKNIDFVFLDTFTVKNSQFLKFITKIDQLEK